MTSSLRHRAPLLWLTLAFAAGLALGKIENNLIRLQAALAISAFFIGGAWCWRRNFLFWSFLFPIAIMASGDAYYILRRNWRAEWQSRPPREMTLRLRATRIFAGHASSKNINGFARIVETDTRAAALVGQRIYFSVRIPAGTPPLIVSSEFWASGVLAALKPGDNPAGFDRYLEAEGLNFRFDRGRWLHLAKRPTAYRQFCATAKAALAKTLGYGLENHPDLVAILRAMLLGEPAELSPIQHALFVESGTMHLFAIAGLHIGAIAMAFHVCFGAMRLPQVFRFLCSTLLLWLFVDITGDTPSAVRALVMIVLVEAAWLLRRPINPIATLAFSAFVALVAEPLQLFTAGFQMSYAIVASLLLYGLPLAELAVDRTAPFRRLPRSTWTLWHRMIRAFHRWLLGAAALGVSTAIIATICGILYFGVWTPGACVANLAVLPLATLSLWAGLLAEISQSVRAMTLVNIFNHAAALLQFAIQCGLEWLVNLPGAFVAAHFKTAIWGESLLIAEIATLLAGYAVRWRWGACLAPLVILAAGLSLGVHFGA